MNAAEAQVLRACINQEYPTIPAEVVMIGNGEHTVVLFPCVFIWSLEDWVAYSAEHRQVLNNRYKRTERVK